MVLLLLQQIVGFMATCATIGQMFAGMFMCKVIYQKRSTKRIPSLPFVAGFTLSILLLEQSRLIGNGALAFSNFIGVILNLGYLIFYYMYSKKKVQNELVMKVSKSLLLASLLILYSNLEDESKVIPRYGTIVSVILLAFIAAPLLRLPEVFEKKSTEGLPYPMILSGFVVSTLWFIYSILIWNELLFVQNGLAALICGFQLYLFKIFPEKAILDNVKSE